jgi:hypothetical protein
MMDDFLLTHVFRQQMSPILNNPLKRQHYEAKLNNHQLKLVG